MTINSQARLARALAGRAGPSTIAEARSRPWASITFSGARHWFVIDLAGDPTGLRARTLARALPEAEFELGPDLLADLAAAADPARPGRIAIEALTVEAG